LTKLDYFDGLVVTINKKYNYQLSVTDNNSVIQLKSGENLVYSTDEPIRFESALKSLKKDGVISHWCFEGRKDYKDFLKQRAAEGLNVKQAHQLFFKSLL